jgi:integration host factor subunit beta
MLLPKVTGLRSGALCSFYAKEYETYAGRNPKSGEKVTVKAKKLPFFKAGMELKRRVDG